MSVVGREKTEKIYKESGKETETESSVCMTVDTEGQRVGQREKERRKRRRDREGQRQKKIGYRDVQSTEEESSVENSRK